MPSCSPRVVRRPQSRIWWLAALALSPLALAGCTGNGPASTAQVDDFALLSTNVQPGAVWALNRKIVLRFNREVDLNTVTANTIAIVGADGTTATGLFSFGVSEQGSIERSEIVFQPSCPALQDFSDAGLLPDADYTLVIQSGIGNLTSVQDTAGQALEQGGGIAFRTAAGTSLSDLFVDTLPGPPRVRVRGGAGVALDDPAATYLELGGDPDQRAYFELDENAQGALPSGVLAPLNLYSIEETQVAAVVFFDQALAPGGLSSSDGSARVGLEWRVTTSDDDWLPLVSLVTLEANCEASGAIVRIVPQGVLPADAEVRVVVRPGLADITGESTLTLSDRAGLFRTQSAQAADQTADEILERFTAGADSPSSREDRSPVDGQPLANWGGGKLEANFAFDGTGGIGGDFDLVLGPGEELFLLTTFGEVTGGPDGTPSFSQDVVDGVLDVNDLRIGPEARLVFSGPNPVTILASGEVEIAGEISVRGSNNNGVGALNTTSMPEVGSAGNAGGGTGGTGSPFQFQSSPRGGAGSGSDNAPGQGGQGGEAGYGLPLQGDRRGAGGGGGQLGVDIFYDHDANTSNPDRHCQTLIGMDAEQGAGGTATGTGAVSQSNRPMGGAPGPRPFLDDSDRNDFFGSMLAADGEFIEGESQVLLGGAGGGGGGDAVNSASFPLTPFLSTGDEKGSGGGGAAGALRILAIGPILIREGGSIVADGGYGGGGENTFDSARVAGGGGGGSGGHIVLSSAAFVEFQGEASGAGDGYRDDPDALNHFPRPLSALGGQGGEGHRTDSSGGGGASGAGNTRWSRDGIIPVSRMIVPAAEGGNVPPLSAVYENFFPDFGDPLGPALAAGGDGGPGIVQIHLDDPAMNLRFTHSNAGGAYGVPGGADVTRSLAPPPVGWNGPDAQADELLPFFGPVSASQSQWIHLGLPAQGPEGELLPVEFLFGGIDPSTGNIEAVDGLVTSLPPVLGPLPVGQGPGSAQLLPGGLSFALDATGLPEPYATSSQLLIDFELILEEPGTGQAETYVVQAVSADPADSTLTVFVAETGTTPAEFLQGASAQVQASLIPRFFALETDGLPGRLPPGASVALSFDATVSNALNQPDEAASFSAAHGGSFTSDLEALGAVPRSWVRFRAVFNLSGDGELPLDQPRPALRLIRLPFLFQ